MKTAHTLRCLAVTLAAIQFSACSEMQITHVAPGKSASAALAARNRPPQPATDATTPGGRALSTTTPAEFPQQTLPPLPSGEVKIPSGNGAGDGVSDSYSRGTFAMQAGQTGEAIAAFEQTVKLDPDFTDAWGKLAILYQKTGDSAKATDAFKKAKRLGDANGGTVSRDAAGGLQLQ